LTLAEGSRACLNFDFRGGSSLGSGSRNQSKSELGFWCIKLMI
jgi:hypothetical protein